MFLYIDPLKQGLKLYWHRNACKCLVVFIHRSIKTRIETYFRNIWQICHYLFLYIDPLKQGLKLYYGGKMKQKPIEFLYIDPLKQGLKQGSTKTSQIRRKGFYT